MHTENRIPMGDRHGAKQVELVSDSTGTYLFKPRNARVEKAFEAFLLTLEKEGFAFVPACEHVLEETPEGYKARYEAPLHAETQADVQLYFKKCGALLFIAYLLGATDLHFENIIASRDTPILIDCETLISGQTASPGGRLRNLADTVMASHLLPYWKRINKKTMLVSGLISDMPEASNELVFENKRCKIYDYEDALLEGFRAAYRFALAHTDTVRAALRHFEGCSFRMILRPSAVYDTISSICAKMAPDKAKHSAYELLSVGYKHDIRPDRLRQMQAVIEAEIQAVLSDNIPLFSVKYESTGLYEGEVELAADFLAVSPAQTIKEKLVQLSQEDMTAQTKIISQSLAAVRPLAQPVYPSFGEDTAIHTCFRLLEDGYISALSAGWMKLEKEDKSELLFLENAGFGLYSGTAGILCAYAAMYHRTGQKEYLAALEAHYAPLHGALESVQSIPMDAPSLSLQSGMGGVLLALLHIHALTEQNIFYEDCLKLFEKIDFTAPKELGDLLCGCSGIALALPRLHTPKTAACAQALLRASQTALSQLTGAAHGTAGIALAIAAAQKAANTAAYDDTIIRLLQFEDRYYHSQHHNWQDLRYAGTPVFMNGWCAGAPGIAMTRARIAELSDHPEIRRICKQDIERAAKNLNSDLIVGKDSLCCGNAARIMALSRLGMQNERIYAYLQDALLHDTLHLFHYHNTCDRNYGLMQGIAGIGYALAMDENKLSGGMLC